MEKLILISIQLLLLSFVSIAAKTVSATAANGNTLFTSKIVLAVIIAFIGLATLRSFLKGEEQ